PAGISGASIGAFGVDVRFALFELVLRLIASARVDSAEVAAIALFLVELIILIELPGAGVGLLNLDRGSRDVGVAVVDEVGRGPAGAVGERPACVAGEVVAVECDHAAGLAAAGGRDLAVAARVLPQHEAAAR